MTASCATAPEPAPKGPAGATWQGFLEKRRELRDEIRAIDVKSSINLDTPERKTRLIISFWGNLDYPLRLDLTTGFGAPVAYSREDRLGFTAYDPNSKTAYLSDNSRRGARILGLTMPFDLRDLAALAAGTFLDLLPGDYVRAEPADSGGWKYYFGEESAVGAAVLSPGGRLSALSGSGEKGPWVMSLKDYAGNAPYGESRPERLVFRAGRDIKAILRIKDMRRMAEAWPEESLNLPLPPGTRTKILEP
jgi:hypothetical protein